MTRSRGSAHGAAIAAGRAAARAAREAQAHAAAATIVEADRIAARVAAALKPEQAAPVPFLDRPSTRCAWPLGDWRGPIEDRMCCGAPVLPPPGAGLSGPRRGLVQPYCDDHRDLSAGLPPGTSAARRRVFAAAAARLETAA